MYIEQGQNLEKLTKKQKGQQMNTLLNFVKKLNIDQSDRNLAMDYISYFGIEEDELLEYADEFVSVCYTYNEETGEHEQRMPDELPFADVEYLDNGFVKYTYGDCSVTKRA